MEFASELQLKTNENAGKVVCFTMLLLHSLLKSEENYDW
jgi:hypothetical protein